LQVYASLDPIATSAQYIQKLEVLVVLDHFAMALASIADPVNKLATALLDANAARMLWVSDWPHTNRDPKKNSS
jgi:2-pyrone-4,6-dicarboxylate lactonase